MELKAKEKNWVFNPEKKKAHKGGLIIMSYVFLSNQH